MPPDVITPSSASSTLPRFIEVLDRSQADHLKRMVGILRKFSFAIDRSQMGAGKSYIAASVADLLKFERIVIICPATMEGEWQAMLDGKRIARPIESLAHPPIIMSYEMLRGSRSRTVPTAVSTTKSHHHHHHIVLPMSEIGVCGKDGKTISTSSIPTVSALSHGLLTVSQIPSSRTSSSAVSLAYYPTPLLYEYINSRTLFVFDESHKAKNTSAATHDAVSTIIRTIYSKGGDARVMLLSGTLFDKQQHALALAHLLGVSTTADMSAHNRSLQAVVLTGVKDIMKFIKTEVECLPESAPDPDYTGGHLILDTATAKLVAYDLMVKVVIPAISSAIETPPEVISRTRHATASPPPPPTTAAAAASASAAVVAPTPIASLDCSNFFAKMTDQEAEMLRNALRRLQSVVSYNPQTRDVVVGGRGSAANWGEITLVRVEIEAAKRGAFVRTAISELEKDPATKVVIAVNYLESVRTISAALRASGVIPPDGVAVITGETPKRTRTTIMEQFNSDECSSIRVIVANLKVVSHGISLDDQTGKRPRFVLASPSYYAIDQHQFVRRFYRRNTRGRVKIRFVYGNVSYEKTVVREDHVLASLARKAQVLRDTSSSSSSSAPSPSPQQKTTPRIGTVLYADEYPSDWEEETEK